MKKIGVVLCLGVLLSSSFLSSSDVGQAKEGLNPKVINFSKKTISQKEIDAIVQRSREVAQETKENNRNSNGLLNDSNQLVNYYLIEGDIGYFYEMTPEKEETLQVFNIESTIDTYNTQDKDLIGAQDIGLFNALPDGIGGRVRIVGDGNYISSTVTLPTAAQMGTTQTGVGYVYSGFSGTKSNGQSIETDMGLQYSINNHGTLKMKPYFKFDSGDTDGFGSHLPGYNIVNDQNGFKMGTNITMTVYKNVNGNTRLSQLGTAICRDVNCYSQGDTYLTSIVEVSGTNVNTVRAWKLLATIAGSDSVKGKNYARFTGVNVDGVTKTPVADGADYATISVGTGTATITVSNP